MPRGGIRIPADAVTISVRHEPLRITYPRLSRIIIAALALLGGMGVWLYQLPDDAWRELLHYALGLLLIAPGVCAAGWAVQRRPVVTASGDALIVRYGRPFVERPVARLPLDALEVQVISNMAEAVRYDARVLSRRLLAAVSSASRGALSKSEVRVHVLQVRAAGQDAWLSLFGSQLGSEVESARLAVLAAVGGAPVLEAADAEPGEEVSPSHESR